LTVIWERALRLPPGDTRVIGCCAVFKVREEANPLPVTASNCPAGAGCAPVSQNSTACGSLRRRRKRGRRTCQVRSTCLVSDRIERWQSSKAETANASATGALERAP
jgi:hypothetical protein